MEQTRTTEAVITSWFRLLRLPNILTVPGDVLAGFLLAGIATRNTDCDYKSLLFCMCTSVCIYCAGLLQNDYCDRKKDEIFRPERPIPAGQVSAGRVIGVAIGLFLLGLLFSWAAGSFPLMICVAMICSVVSYNCLTKKTALLGAVNMGLCRGLSLLLGASVLGRAGVDSEVTLVSAGFLTMYIGTLTLIAYDEQKPDKLGLWHWLLPFIMICWFVTLPALPIQMPMIPIDAGVVCIIGGIALLRAILNTAKVGRFPEAKKLQHFVGEMVRVLILIQATMVSLANPFLGAMLLIAWIASNWLSKYFYSS